MATFTSVDLSSWFNAPRLVQPSPWHPRIQEGLAGLPEGEQVFWGIPFVLGAGQATGSWIQLKDAAVSIPVSANEPITFVVLAHFCDASFDPARPEVAPGIVTRPGEKLADYALVYSDDSEHAQPIRRRFEINEVIEWGQLPFAARVHTKDTALDLNGPYPRQQWGRYQVGLASRMRAPGGGTLWIYALPNPYPERTLRQVRLAPTGAAHLAVLGMTLYHKQEHPLRHRRLESFCIALPISEANADPEQLPVDVDMGVVARKYAVPAFDPDTWLAEEGPGRGEPAPAADVQQRLFIDLTANPEATLTVGEKQVPLRSVYDQGHGQSADGHVQVELLTPRKTWLHATVEDGDTGKPTPVRVHFRAPDGRYFPPYGHRHQVNSNWFEDYGADLKLGTTQYAYVDGTFQIELPVGDVYVEIFKGFEYTPVRQRLTILPGQRELKLKIGRAYDWRSRGWVTADTHVHFISPQTAWLEGQAEGVNLVNLLASQWGDLFTNVGDLSGKVSGVSESDTIVYVGTENRQHLMGHMSLLGVRGNPIYPMTTGGPSESYLGDPIVAGLTEWAEAARRQDGVVVIPHFPNPYCEVVASIVLGKVDGVELKLFSPGLNDFGVMEWYRYLNCGYRVAAVGGTDKMSATIPVGGVRTYALLDDEFRFDSWARAVRAGRTFTSSGPLIDLRVEGKRPGDAVALPARGGQVEVEAWAESVLPFHELQVVCNGQVVAAESAESGGLRRCIKTKVTLAGSGWIAARCVSRLKLWHTWPVNVAAHTSPVYLVAGGQELFSPSDATYMLTLLEGGLTWLDTLSIPAEPEREAAVKRAFEDAQAHLEGRLHHPRHEAK